MQKKLEQIKKELNELAKKKDQLQAALQQVEVQGLTKHGEYKAISELIKENSEKETLEEGQKTNTTDSTK